MGQDKTQLTQDLTQPEAFLGNPQNFFKNQSKTKKIIW